MRRLRPALTLFLLGLAVLCGFRAFLYFERQADLADLAGGERFELWMRGTQLDAIVVAALCIPLLLAFILVPARWLRGTERVASVWAALVLLGLVAAETSGIYFFRYYDFRFNYLVLEHGTDAEVAGTVVRAYPIGTIVAVVVAIAAVAFFAWRKAAGLPVRDDRPAPRWPALIALPFIAFCLRGTTDHRALGPAYAAFSDNRVANEITGNGILNVAHEWAQRSKGRYVGLAETIELLPEAEAIANARAYFDGHGTFIDGADNPLARVVGDTNRKGPKNVMVVVLESYTARLVGHLGGHPALTPNLDQLATESLVLDHCYATGERTIQGLEAVLSSFPPLPGVGVVRRPEARDGFDTLATVMKQRGYATRFLYGGQGIFDHMSAFFLANGYDEFIEEEDFDHTTFHGEWGYCDEDVLNRADREMRTLHAAGTPFLVTVLTVSLHSPWEYPKGVIEPLPTSIEVPDGFEYEELNTFRYVDEAIGRFMARAKQAPYYDDTVFAFVGDHGVHLRGRDLVPADEYRVAALIHAPKHVPPRRFGGVTSQLDVAPTLLSIVGGTWKTTFFGRDLLAREPNEPGTALLVYGKKRFAFIDGPRMTVLARAKRTAFAQTPGSSKWSPSALLPEHERDAVLATSLLQTAEWLLENDRYRALSEAETEQLLRH